MGPWKTSEGRDLMRLLLRSLTHRKQDNNNNEKSNYNRYLREVRLSNTSKDIDSIELLSSCERNIKRCELTHKHINL